MDILTWKDTKSSHIPNAQLILRFQPLTFRENSLYNRVWKYVLFCNQVLLEGYSHAPTPTLPTAFKGTKFQMRP